MNETMKAEASPIPTALRDWLDHAILSQMNSSAAPEQLSARKTSIANAILYPLQSETRKSKNRGS